MPAIFKRSNGFYYAILTDEHGRRKWVSTKERTKSNALLKLATLGDSVEVQVSHPHFSQFILEFTEYARATFSSETLGVYMRAFNRFKCHAGNLTINLITERQIDQFKSARLREVKPVTVNLELRTLRAAFYTAKRWRMLDENPFANVQLCRAIDEVPPHLSIADFLKLVKVAPHRWLQDIFILTALTGMRRGEAINMRWVDVDMNLKAIRIQSHGTFRTKSGGMRTLPMNPHVYSLLARKQTEKTGEYVFEINGRRVQDRGLSRWFKKCVRRAGLNDKLHFHSLRHSFASWLVQQNVSLYEVQRLLGHSSIKVTEIYSHLAPQKLHESVARIPIEF